MSDSGKEAPRPESVELPAAETVQEQRQKFFDQEMKKSRELLDMQRNLTEEQKQELLINAESSLNKYLDYEEIKTRGGFSENDMQFLAGAENPYNTMSMSVAEKERLYNLQGKVQGIREVMREEVAQENIGSVEGHPDSLDKFVEVEESAEEGKVERMVSELEQQGKDIDGEWEKLNAEAVEAGRKKYGDRGFDSAEWSDELKQKLDAVKRKSEWNFRLKNEVTNPSEANAKPRSLEEIEKSLRERIAEGVSRFNQQLEEQEISSNDRIKIYQNWDKNEAYPEEYFFSHVDPENGLVYVSETKVKKGGSSSLIGLKIEDVKKISKGQGGVFDKLKSKLKGRKSKSSSQEK